MKPIEFDGANCVYGKEQPEYQPVPANKDAYGTVVTCWQLEPGDLERIKETGCVWLSVLTFNQALQPVLLLTEKPSL
jgi:hypothetical protein